MSVEAGFSADGLRRRAQGRKAPEWAGVLSLIVIEAVVFTGLIASYFHLKGRADLWPPPGISQPDLLLPTLNSLILFASALPAWLGARAISRGDGRRLRRALLVGLAMLAVFTGLKVFEYSGYDYGPTTHVYGSIVWTMTGLHIAHVLAVMLKTAAVSYLAVRGDFDAEHHVPVDANALYWYFVVLIWVPLFATIYLSHHLF